jgi:hypothetical protein
MNEGLGAPCTKSNKKAAAEKIGGCALLRWF